MKLLQFVFGIIVTITLVYCGMFLLFYSTVMMDTVLLFLAIFFLSLAYFFPKMIELNKNEYILKIKDFIYTYLYKDGE